MNSSFEYITTLEYRLKAANAQIQDFKSGKKYIRMQEEYLKELRSLEQKIRKLEEELCRAHSETVSVRNQWFEIFEELQKECDRKIAALLKKLEQMERRAIKAERQRDEALDKVTKQRHKIYALEAELEDEKGKNLKLRAHSLTVIMKTLPCRLPNQSGTKRFPTAVRKQGRNRADSLDTRVIAEKNRLRQQPLSYYRRRKKF